MASSTLTGESETNAESDAERTDRRKTLVEGFLDNRWTWIIAAVSFFTAGWLSRYIGEMAGTATFYIGLFLAIGLLFLWYGIRNVRRRLKRLKYASSR